MWEEGSFKILYILLKAYNILNNRSPILISPGRAPRVKSSLQLTTCGAYPIEFIIEGILAIDRAFFC